MRNRSDWVTERITGIHMTIRDVDCKDFDAERMAKAFHDMRVEFFSFFCGGHLTTYPTKLAYQRQSPFLDGRDVTGAIVEAAHRYDIKAVAMIDLGPLPDHAAEAHPEWCSVDADGKPYVIMDGFKVACPLGGYINGYAKEIVREIVGLYDVDGIKFGGGSYGFGAYGAGICHCDNCRRAYRAYAGVDIPREKNWRNQEWRTYFKWRNEAAVRQVKALSDQVRGIVPDMPVFGNSVCFGDPGWTLRSALDVEKMAHNQNAVQVEAQTRLTLSGEGDAKWDYIHWPGEEARYMTAVTDKPIWVVASYFLAWPWRRSAAPALEQHQYMAQIAANGAIPMVNLSGGPPAVHEDRRGFETIGRLYRFITDNRDVFAGTASAAQIALVYSHETLVYYGQDEASERYVAHIRGFEQILLEEHVHFDIISNKVLNAHTLARYKLIVLPNMACMSEEEAAVIREYAERGGSVVASGETSLYSPGGERRDNFLLADLWHAAYSGQTARVDGDGALLRQNYMRLQPRHPLTEGLDGTELAPIAGRYLSVETQDADVPLTLAAPFRVFPEGLSYTLKEDIGSPMAVLSEHPAGGRVAYFPNELDRAYWKLAYPDLGTLLMNAVRWAGRGDISDVATDAPSTVHLSVRRKEGRLLVHMINFSGGRRFYKDLVPVRDISVGVKACGVGTVRRAFLLSTRQELPMRREAGYLFAQVDRLTDYDVVVFDE